MEWNCWAGQEPPRVVEPQTRRKKKRNFGKLLESVPKVLMNTHGKVSYLVNRET
jgi:hypothetical protein